MIRKLSTKDALAKTGLSEEEFLDIKKKIYKIAKNYKKLYNKQLGEVVVKTLTGQDCPTKIELDLYKKTAEEVGAIISQHNDLESGKLKLEAVTTTEPKTPEDIIKLLKIDTKKWKLSQYWNKQKSNGTWIVSALVTNLSKEESKLIQFLNVMKDYKFPKVEHSLYKIENSSLLPTCGVLNLQDLHFGKKGNEDMTEIMLSVVRDLLSKCSSSYYLDKLIIVLGGDALNMDTFLNTTTKGTPVESSMSPQDTYVEAFEGLYLLLLLLKSYSNKLNVMFIPGNHDRLSSFHLLHALSKSFNGVDDIKFDVEYGERKVLTYGENMFAFEHGDVSKKTTPLVYATEFPNEWGQTTFRTLFTGHYHIKKTTEYITENEIHGFSIKIMPSLSSTDYWHSHNKFIGSKRSAVLEVYSDKEGKIAEFNKTYKL